MQHKHRILWRAVVRSSLILPLFASAASASLRALAGGLSAVQNAATGSLYDRNGVATTTWSFNDTEFVGDCPGYEASQIKGVSFLGSIAPGPDRRVIITNERTQGFTDRNYAQPGGRSETFSMKVNNHHELRYFTVLPGENDITYKVMEKGQPVGSGTFSVFVHQEIKKKRRGYTRQEDDAFCLGEDRKPRSQRTPIDKCKIVKVQTIGYCPDGSRQVIREDFLR